MHAAGREDIDVRMLGTGRPFIFEFINPKKAISCHEEFKKLVIDNEWVKCHDFKIVDKNFFDKMKEIENLKAKRYCAIVRVGIDSAMEIKDSDIEKLNALNNIEV